jgi:SAM-dependent methyltransferase
VNISSSGVAFELAPAEILRSGQILESVSVVLDDVETYSGRARVINQRDQEGKTIVGVAFLDQYLPPGKLDSASRLAAALREAGQRLHDAQHLLAAGVDDTVKGFVADFRLLLTTLKGALDGAVTQTDSQDHEEEVLRWVEQRAGGQFQDYIRRMQVLPRPIVDDWGEAVREYLKRHLQELLLPAPIYRQAYFKPLGYAGDYVTMNIVYSNHYFGESTYAKFLNRMFCDVASARAIIARRAYLREQIERVAEGHGRSRARIMAVAAGPAREVQDYLTTASPGRPVEFTLLDQDPRALSFAHATLRPLAARFGERLTIRCINGAVKHLVREPERFADLGGQDLIYAAGLFDYLRQDAAERLTANLYSLLAPGGALAIGNLSPACSSLAFLEYLVDWPIISRTDAELTALGTPLSPTALRIDREASGVNPFLVLTR